MMKHHAILLAAAVLVIFAGHTMAQEPVEAPQWVSLEYINGGVDPQNREFSPGSVLSFVNTQNAWSEARALGKPLRYSFGRADREYKDRWCNRQPVYQV